MKRVILSIMALMAIAIGAKAQDMSATPLTLEAVEAGTINIVNPNTLTIEYSKDGVVWTAASSNPVSIDVAAGDKVCFRGDNPAYGMFKQVGPNAWDTREQYTRFTATNDVYIYGNVMSLISSTGYQTLTTLPVVGGESELEEDINLAFLFSTPAGEDDWAPKNNTTIKNHPTKDIVLPAMNVTRCGYMYMFSGCQGLTRAPELPATDLGWGCYHQMFSNCINLEKAPELPAASVPMDGYSWMFNGCTKLNYMKCLATDISAERCTDGWLTGVATEGTFVKAVGMEDWTVGPQGEWDEVDGIPTGWTVEENSAEAGQFVAATTPLTLEAIEDATTVTIANPLALTIQYSTDGGTAWTSASGATITVSGLAAGATVQLRGDNASYSNATRATSTIIGFDKDCYVYGNVMSLVNSTGFATATVLTGDYAFYDLFYQNVHLKNHVTKDLVLPATTLTEHCYGGMFNGCTALTKAPALPATTLATKCYRFMFSSCTSLTVAPELPATTLAEECYSTMFQNTGLTAAPVLPVTKLVKGCYMNLFRSCKQLTTAPVLPATTLAESCYEYMFHSSGLTTAPELPSTVLAPRCYLGMFLNCESLTTAPALPATTLAESCYNGMFLGTGLTAIPELPAEAVPQYAYSQMFQGCNSLTSVPPLTAKRVDKLGYRWMFQYCTGLKTSPAILATSLGEDACYYMFRDCTELETAGDLSATELEDACCEFMFSGCTSLTKAPALPATKLATQCYQRMFEGCTSLVDAPALPATDLAELCYNDMFWECTSLKNAPALPATALADYCYTMMFLGCSSLQTAPVLPAAILTPGCYEHMFMNCSSLNYVKCLATNLGDETSTDGWMTNVAATGTFVQADGADWTVKGTTEGTWADEFGNDVPVTFVHGIPAGWKVEKETVTGIETVALEGSADKTRSMAPTSEGCFDLTGRRISGQPQHGIYVKEGKKVFVK